MSISSTLLWIFINGLCLGSCILAIIHHPEDWLAVVGIVLNALALLLNVFMLGTKLEAKYGQKP